VNWKINDFVIAAMLLLGTTLMIEVIIIKIKEKKLIDLQTVAVVELLLLLWAGMAVGLFGSPLAGH
jgi:hypothetical protein